MFYSWTLCKFTLHESESIFTTKNVGFVVNETTSPITKVVATTSQCNTDIDSIPLIILLVLTLCYSKGLWVTLRRRTVLSVIKGPNRRDKKHKSITERLLGLNRNEWLFLFIVNGKITLPQPPSSLLMIIFVWSSLTLFYIWWFSDW